MTDAPRPTARDPLKGFLFALAGSVLLASNYIIAKYALRGFGPLTFAFIWVSVAALLMLLVIALQGKLRLLAVPRPAVKYVVIIGLFAWVNQSAFWAGLTRLDPSFASFLGRFWQLFAVLGGVLVLRERLSRAEVFAGALMIIGGCVSSVGDWDIVGTGVVLIVIACAAFAALSVTMKLAVRRSDPLVLNFYRLVCASVALGIGLLLSGAADFARAMPGHWGALLLGAVLAPCAGVVCMVQSYRYWELSRSTLVYMLQPLLVLPAACLALGMYPTRQQVIGGLIILAGGLWLVWIHGRRSQRRS